MKFLEIVVPTYNRPKEIERFLESSQKLIPVEGWEFGVRVRYGTKPEALTSIVNGLVAESRADAVMVLADHLVMHSDCLVECLPYLDENEDIMVGLNIENLPITPGISEYCFFVLGKEFISRFPEKQIFCPDYYHFYADNELGQYAHGAGITNATVTAFVKTEYDMGLRLDNGHTVTIAGGAWLEPLKLYNGVQYVIEFYRADMQLITTTVTPSL